MAIDINNKPCYTEAKEVINMEENFGLIDVEELHKFKGEDHDANLTLDDYFDIFIEEFN